MQADPPRQVYGRGAAIEFSLEFSQAVTLVGTPELAFSLDGEPRKGTYDTQRSTSTVLRFAYTVAQGDEATGGPLIADLRTAFTLPPGGSLKTASGERAIAWTLDSPLAFPAHPVVWTAGLPRADIESIVFTSSPSHASQSGGTADTYAITDTIAARVRFDEPVRLPTNHLTLALTLDEEHVLFADLDRQASSANEVLFKAEVKQGHLATEGVRIGENPIGIAGLGTILTDANEVPASLSYPGLAKDPAHRIDWRASFPRPVLSLVSILSRPGARSAPNAELDTYALNENLRFGASFTHPVVVDPALALLVELGARTVRLDLAPMQSTPQRLVFERTVISGDIDTDGVAVPDVGSAFDPVPLSSQTALPANVAYQTLDDDSGHRVDWRASLVRPTVDSVEVRSTAPRSATPGQPANAYGSGDTLEVAVTFSMAVTVTGSPSLALDLDGTERLAVYTAQDPPEPTVLVFSHVVAPPELATAGIAINANALRLGASDAIVSTGQPVDANLAHTRVAADPQHRVDWQLGLARAAVSSVTIISIPTHLSSDTSSVDAYAPGERLEFSATFTEAVDVDGIVRLDFSLDNGEAPGTARAASHLPAQSTGDTLVFGYTIATSDEASRGLRIGADAIRLVSGASITTRSTGTDARLGHAAQGLLEEHRIDPAMAPSQATVQALTLETAPTLRSTPFGALDTHASETVLVFALTFDRAVAVAAAPSLTISFGAPSDTPAVTRKAVYDAVRSTSSVLRFTYTVTASDRAPDGLAIATLPSALELESGAAIGPASGDLDPVLDHPGLALDRAHRIDGTLSTGEASASSITIVSTPTIRSTATSDPDTYGLGDAIELALGFSTPVVALGALELVFSLGAPDAGTSANRRAPLTTDTGTAASQLVFSYTVQSADLDPDGVSAEASPHGIVLATNALLRTQANGLDASTSTPALAPDPGHLVDASASSPEPARLEAFTVVSTPKWRSSASSPADTYAPDDTIELALEFDKPVRVTGTTRLAFSVENADATERLADHVPARSTATRLVFAYSVDQADTAPGGLALAAPGEALRPTGGTSITTVSNELAPQLGTHAPGVQTGHRVDGALVPPAIEDLSITSTPSNASQPGEANDLYVSGDDIVFAVRLTEAVAVTATPVLTISLGTEEQPAARTASYDAGLGTDPRELRFAYTVAEDDTDPDGVHIDPNSLLVPDGAAIRSARSTMPATLLHAALPIDAAHRVGRARRVGIATTIPAIQGLAASPGVSSVTLRWDPPDENPERIHGYELRRYASDEPPDDAAWEAITPVTRNRTLIHDSLVHMITSLSTGDSYTFDVRATGVPDTTPGVHASVSASVSQSLCPSPELGGRRRLVTSPFYASPFLLESEHQGLGFHSATAGLMPRRSFSVNGESYTLNLLANIEDPASPGLHAALDPQPPTLVARQLSVHICDTDYPLPDTMAEIVRLGAAANLSSDLTRTVVVSAADPLDLSPPSLIRLSLAQTALLLHYDEILDPDSVPGANAYAVAVDDTPLELGHPDPVSIDGPRVKLLLASAPGTGATVSVDYDAPATNAVSDRVGHRAPSFAERTFTVPRPGQDIRLVGGDSDHEGRVEVRHNGVWGTVCDDYWTDRTADLICRLLGFPEGSQGDSGRFVSAHFGAGTGPIHLDDLRCTGTESSLFECRHRGIGVSNCRHTEDAGVACITGTRPAVAKVEIAPEPTTGEPWNAGDTLSVTLEYDTELVLEQGDTPPTIDLVLDDSTSRTAAYTPGGTATTLRFTTEVEPSDAPLNMVQVVADTLNLNGAQLYDPETSRDALIGHPGAVRMASQDPTQRLLASISIPEDPGYAFDLLVEFNLEVTLDAQRLGESVLRVDNARLTGIAKTNPPSTRSWRVSLERSGTDAVTVMMMPTQDCADPGAVCTADGTRLARGVTARAPALPGFSVADAQVLEAPGALLEFAITVDRPSSVRLAVRYETRDVSAVAPDDYAQKSGIALFEPGITMRMVAVEVEHDAHDEGTETMELHLTGIPVTSGLFPRAYIADDQATGTIYNTGPLPLAWHLRFARTVTGQIADIVSERLDTAPGSRVVIGGVDANPGHAYTEAPGPREPLDGPEARSLDFSETLGRSSFDIAHDSDAAYRTWGRVAFGGFRSIDDGLKLDADVRTAAFGIEARSPRALIGVAVARSLSDARYGLTAGTDEGDISGHLNSIYPYAAIRVRPWLSTWGMLGAGSGSFTLAPDERTELRSDFSMQSAGFGTRVSIVDDPGIRIR